MPLPVFRRESMEFISGVLALFDGTVKAMLGIPVLASFLGGYLLFAALGLALLLKDAASGQGRRK